MGSSLDLFGNVMSETVRNAQNRSKNAAHKPASKVQKAYLTISETAKELDVATHVLRFWEGKFSEVQPMKRSGGRRYYRAEDVALLKRIKTLLYDEGYTIRGVQTYLKKSGSKAAIKEQSTSEAKVAAQPAALIKELEAIRAILVD